MRAGSTVFVILIALAFLLPTPVLAGPICSGIGCTAIYLVLWSVGVLPFALIPFVIMSLVFFRICHQKTTWWKWALIAIVSIVATHITYGTIQTSRIKNAYQEQEVTKASTFNFTLYEPLYVVLGFDLIENSARDIYAIDELVYEYYNRDTQNSPDSQAKERYRVVIRKIESKMSPKDTDERFIITKNVGDARIEVVGTKTVSESEAQKVMDSLKMVDSSEIKFYSDWAGSRL